jgi:plasmid stabilization system protein ParE
MRVRWTKTGQKQLLEIFIQVAEERPKTARKLVSRLKKAARELGDQPLRGRVVPEFNDPSIRERLVRPYRILYSVQTDVFILAVYHGRRLLPEKPEDL